MGVGFRISKGTCAGQKEILKVDNKGGRSNRFVPVESNSKL